MSVFGYLDQLIDEKSTNFIECWYLKHLIWLHQNGKMPLAFLPKKAKHILWQWEDEMEVEYEQRRY